MECIKNKDSDGFDICQVTQKTLKELHNICQFIPHAEGFNSGGWIKYHISDLNDFQGHNLFKLKKEFKQLKSKYLPQIWCINEESRDDCKEWMKMSEIGKQINFFNKCEQSHYKLWLQLLESDWSAYLILENDIGFCDNFEEKLSHIYASVNDFDIIYLGFNNEVKDFWSDSFPKIKPYDNKFTGYNMFAYIISKSGAKKLTNYIKENGFTHSINNISKLLLTRYMTIPHLTKCSRKEEVKTQVNKPIIIPEKKTIIVNETPTYSESPIMSRNNNYKFFLENLKYNINNSDIKTFKQWDCFGKKGLWIFVPDDHIANTFYEQNLKDALTKFKIEDLRDPVPSPITKENGTDALIVRNAGNFARTGIDLNQYDHILEIGGGYGALANVILNSGFKGTYTIYDFKWMEKVDRHYIQHPIQFVSDPKIIQYMPKTLLISTWGMSEMPSKLVYALLKNCPMSGYYIIVQNFYDKRNNIEFFSKLLGIQPQKYDNRSVMYIK